VCGVWYKDTPVNGDNTISQFLDTTLLSFGISDINERARIELAIRSDSERILSAIIQHEYSMTAQERGAILAQCDLIGIDYVLAEINGVVTPVGIEVNGPNCTINCDIAEFVHSHTAGEAFRMYVANMISRSLVFIMKRKCVLVIGAERCSLSVIRSASNDYDVQVSNL